MATTFEVVHGDITHQPAEAIVNAANSELWMGGGGRSGSRAGHLVVRAAAAERTFRAALAELVSSAPRSDADE